MRGTVLLLLLVSAGPLSAQGWRLRVDARGQSTSYRGWQLDSIPATDTVTGSTGGPETPDGYVAHCVDVVCRYWRPGGTQHGAPTLLTTEGALWGLGVRGLSLHTRLRAGLDLSANNAWYGPDRGVELLEGYADLERDRYRIRAGRQIVDGRLGWWGIDGGRVWGRSRDGTAELSFYGGWGLARSANLTATSEALNPLGEFQTAERQTAWGATARWSVGHGSIEGQYHREVSGVDGGITIERAAVSVERLVTRSVGLSGGAVYDIASGLWGSWDVGLRAGHGPLTASAGVRQYRPLFDLWSIWQAFSPTASHAVTGGLGARLHPTLALRLTGERYWFDDTETSTPLVTIEDRGWRSALGATWTPRPALTVDAELRREFGVGALANALQGSASWLPDPRWTLRLSAGHLERPLEYRYDVATLDWLGIGADWKAGDHLGLGATLDRWGEERDRPDAAAFSWDQTRFSVRVIWQLSSADHLVLPPGRPRGAP